MPRSSSRVRSSAVFVLALALAACASAPPPAPVTAQVLLLEGTVALEAHLARPHATMTRSVAVRLLQRDGDLRCEWTESDRGANASTTVYLRHGGITAVQDGSGAFKADDGDGARLLDLCAALVAATGSGEFHVDFAHLRLGDVRDSVAWRARPGERDWSEAELTWHARSTQGVWSLRRVQSGEAEVAASEFALGAVTPLPPMQAPRMRTLASGVHAFELPDIDARCVVVEFADHLVLLETGLDGIAGERLLNAIERQWPDKRIRYVLCGHHHPHYTGGLRPVLAQGATLVAPPLLAAYARELAALPFTRQPDALARHGEPARIEALGGERRFVDGANELIAFDIGADSHHTDEYVVFWLPKQGILFEGDLGFFGGDGTPLRAGGVRTRGLLAAIDKRALPVRLVVQGWPVQGSLPALSLDRLRALVAAQSAPATK